jgi:hypothetical protein
MYTIKSTSRVLAVLSVAALVLAASVNADARGRAGAVGTMAPAGVAVNEILGMEVRTHTGEEIASIEDVIVSDNGQVMEVVLDYEGDLVAVPMEDLRFTSRDHVIYEGTRSDLDAARDYYVYGQGPYVYHSRVHSGDRRGYYMDDRRGADMRFGTGLRDRDRFAGSSRHRVYSGPDTPRGDDLSYGAVGYGADVRFGTGLRARDRFADEGYEEGYIREDDRRGYYKDDRGYYASPHRRGIYSGPDTGDRGYGDRGYGAEMRFGPQRRSHTDYYDD